MEAFGKLLGELYPPLEPIFAWGVSAVLVYFLFASGALSGLFGLFVGLCATYGGRFLLSVTSGTATWFFTHIVFGHGIHDASVSGIATAAVIGGISNFVGKG